MSITNNPTKGPPVKVRPFGLKAALALCAVALLSACAAPPPAVTSSAGFDDPHEAANRRVHEFNKAVDRAVLRPVFGTGAGASQVLGPVRTGIRNLGGNLDTPRRIVNNVLQGRFENAGHNTFRLAVNTIVGVGGLFDPATSFGLEERDTDFGETLHVWGSPEGAFVSVPLLGPSTTRDTVGDLMDFAINPAGWVFSPEALVYTRSIRLLKTMTDRSRFAATVDDVLYNSADSYAQTRLIYLQNRRFELARNAAQARGGRLEAAAPAGVEEEVFVDPYADPLGEAGATTVETGVNGAAGGGVAGPVGDAGFVDPYSDPYGETFIDPYEESYAQ